MLLAIIRLNKILVKYFNLAKFDFNILNIAKFNLFKVIS